MHWHALLLSSNGLIYERDYDTFQKTGIQARNGDRPWLTEAGEASGFKSVLKID